MSRFVLLLRFAQTSDREGTSDVVATGIARVRMSRRRKIAEGERAFISFSVTAEKGRLAERR
jgi:hypothetical protein